MRPPADKWAILPDDTNPRKAQPQKPKEIRIYKLWTLKGQTVKAMEALTPTTTIQVFRWLIENYNISTSEKSLNVVRRTLTTLQKDGTILVDLSVRRFEGAEYGTHSLLILNPIKKWKMI